VPGFHALQRIHCQRLIPNASTTGRCGLAMKNGRPTWMSPEAESIDFGCYLQETAAGQTLSASGPWF
jgi:hypothetical protein